MGKRIKDYVKYTKKELEIYVNTKNSCVKKINRKIHLNLPPHGIGINFKKTLMHIISEKKIGSYDPELSGIILDVRDIKVLGHTGAIRFDDPNIHLDIQADCYAFQPRIGSIVHGIVKHISSRQMGVIIYRVFSVSIRLEDQNDLESIELNSEIEFRIKNFDLKNMMPYIEGELVAKEIPLLGSTSNHIYMNANDSDESSSSDEDENEYPSTSKKLIRKAMFEEIEEKPKEVFKVPKTPKRKSILSKYQHLTDDNDDEEIIFSEIFHLNQDQVKEIEEKKNKKIETKMLKAESNKTKSKIFIKLPNQSDSPNKKKSLNTSDEAKGPPKKQRRKTKDVSDTVETENVSNSSVKADNYILNNSTSLQSRPSFDENEEEITQFQRTPIKIEDVNGYESSNLFEDFNSDQTPFKLSGSEKSFQSTIKSENSRHRTISRELNEEIVEIKKSPNKKVEKIGKMDSPIFLNGASKEDSQSKKKISKNKKELENSKDSSIKSIKKNLAKLKLDFDSESVNSAKTSRKSFKKIQDSEPILDHVSNIKTTSRKRKTSEKDSNGNAKKIKT